MKKKILIADILIEKYYKIYEKNFDVDFLYKSKKINYTSYEALVITGGFKASSSFLKKFKNLKIISVFGVGYDGIDIRFCEKKNITVTNTPKILTNDVADLAVCLIIGISRNVVNGHNHVISNLWPKEQMRLSSSLTRKSVGIVGMGEIGKAIAKRAVSLSMSINYFGPNKKNNKYGYINNLEKLANISDYLVITCKGGKETNKIISKKVINSMKEDSFLINISRGSVIDENALLSALENKKIRGAALDVFNNEPNINIKFKKLDNVFLSPHHGSGTHETREEMAKLSNRNMYNFFRNKKPINSIL